MRRHTRDQLQHPSFGHVIGRVVCARCGRRELAHLRRYQDGTVRAVVADPSSRNARLRARAKSAGIRADSTVVTFALAELADTGLMCRCRKHGKVSVSRELLAEAAEGVPRRLRVVEA